MPVSDRCDICGKEYDPADGKILQAVKGYEDRQKTRVSGSQGGSDIVLRRKVPGWIHAIHVHEVRAGITPGQETLT